MKPSWQDTKQEERRSFLEENIADYYLNTQFDIPFR